MTYRCGLPLSSTGSIGKVSIFGIKGNQPQRLPKFLWDKEILMINTPIKIALIKSCQANLIHLINEKKYYLNQSSGSEVCFYPMRATNKPPYSEITESVIESCYAEHLGLHVIHIADFGFQRTITPGKENCPPGKRFQEILLTTQKGITVEICQVMYYQYENFIYIMP